LTAIVTGAGGFIGRWLVEQLVFDGYSVLAIIRPQSLSFPWIGLQTDKSVEIICCDIANYDDLPMLIGRRNGAVFFHLAWAGVSGHDRENLDIQIQNVKSSISAVEAAAQIGCTRFVGVGSMMEEESFIATKGDGLLPSPGYTYGAMKYLAHLQTKIAAIQVGIEYLWPVLTNAYGEYENSPRLINTTLRKIINHEPLNFTSGSHLCDFVYVEDAVRALSILGTEGKPFCDYVIGSGQPATVREYIERIGEIFKVKEDLLFGIIPYSGVHLLESSFSIEKLKQDTGFFPKVSFVDGIVKTMKWISKQADVDLK